MPWRSALVNSWNPVRDAPGLGLELDDAAIAAPPYVQNSFPSLWDASWLTDFKQDKK